MSRLPPCAAVLALLALSCCLFLHASSASDTPLSPGLRVLQEMEAPASLAANDQVLAVPGEVESSGDVVSGRRMELELEDYPGSGANDRHSPWWQQRRN